MGEGWRFALAAHIFEAARARRPVIAIFMHVLLMNCDFLNFLRLVWCPVTRGTVAHAIADETTAALFGPSFESACITPNIAFVADEH